MQTILEILFKTWPGRFGLTQQEILAFHSCRYALQCDGRRGDEVPLFLNKLAQSGIAVCGHVLHRSDDLYYWVKV